MVRLWELVHDVLGHDRFYLAGHDWGGVVAYGLAAGHRDPGWPPATAMP